MIKTVLIADDYECVRMGVRMILAEVFPKFQFYFAPNFTETKAKLRTEKIDILFLDIKMPDSIYTLMIKEIRDINQHVKIILFSNYTEDFITSYIKEGADGYVNKDASSTELIKAVKSIIDNGYYYNYSIIKALTTKSKTNPKDILSERELQVFYLLSEGNGNIEIANLLNLQLSTIGTYKRRVFEKLSIRSIVELVKIKETMH